MEIDYLFKIKQCINKMSFDVSQIYKLRRPKHFSTAIKLLLACMIFMPANLYAEYLILRGGYVVPEVNIISKDDKNIYFKYNQEDIIRELDLKYVDKGSVELPQNTLQIGPSQFEEYFKIFETKIDSDFQNKIVNNEENIKGMDNLEMYKLYDANKKYGFVAFGLAWIIPSLGHIYAGDAKRGVFFALAETAAACGCLFLFGGSNDVTQTIGYASLLAFPILHVGQAIDAAGSVYNYNEELKRNLRITFDVAKEKVGLKVKYEF